MNVFNQVLQLAEWKDGAFSIPKNIQPDWILVFGDRYSLSQPGIYTVIEERFPDTVITFSSTSGEISGTNFRVGSINITYLDFSTTTIHAVSGNGRSYFNDAQMGQQLVQELPQKGLNHIFLLADGQYINGSELLSGVRSALPEGIKVSGGVAGDDERFEETRVGLNKDPQPGEVVMVGLYGDALEVQTGSSGGFDSFGVDRLVSKSRQNELFELDGQPALELYKKYLGPMAAQLPGAALHFPIMIKSGREKHLARTILSINEDQGSMIFAGDIPEGAYVRLMRTNPDRLIDAAYEAAQQCETTESPELAILVSCVGRKLVLDQRIEEELEAVQEVLGEQTQLVGFYSYGEVCPHTQEACELHNQTMTITTFRERL